MLKPIKTNNNMKTEYRPIGMRCTQEQFDSIKDKIPLNIIDIDSFEYYPYLRNDYFRGKAVSNSLVILKQNIEIHEEFDGELFLDCCGREVELNEENKDNSICECGSKHINTTNYKPYCFVCKKEIKQEFHVPSDVKDAIIKEYLKDKVWNGNEIQILHPEEQNLWINANKRLKYRIKPKPDYTAEIEALEKKAKENGQKVIIKIE